MCMWISHKLFSNNIVPLIIPLIIHLIGSRNIGRNVNITLAHNSQNSR